MASRASSRVAMASCLMFMPSVVGFCCVATLPSTGRRRGLLPVASQHVGPGERRYGCDPRTLHGIEKDKWHDPSRTWPLGETGVVNDLWGGICQLQAVLTDAAASDDIVVIKFKREGCPACAATISRLADAAAANAGRVRFFSVDFHQCQSFCAKCGIQAVPCVHIYVSDALVDVLPFGPSGYDAFTLRLAELMLESSEPREVATSEGLDVLGAVRGLFPFHVDGLRKLLTRQAERDGA